MPCSQGPSILDTLTVSLLCCFLKISLDSFLSSLLNPDVSWLRRLVAGLSKRRPWFNRRPVLLRFVEHKVALEQVVLPVLRCLPVSIIPPMLHTRSVICYDASWRLRNGGLIAARRENYIFCKASRPLRVKNCFLFHGTVPGAKRPEQEVCQVYVRTSGPSEAMLEFSMSLLGLFVCLFACLFVCLFVALQPTSGLDRRTVQVCTAHARTHTHSR